MAKDHVKLLIGVEDKASQVFENFKGKLLGVAAAYASLEGARKGYDLAKDAAKIEDVGRAYRNLTDKTGVDYLAMMAKMKDATGGTIGELKLMQSFNQAALLGLPLDRFDEMLEIARGAAASTGESMEWMLSSITTGLGRQSKMILDNLGILLDTEAAYDSFAKTLGKTADQLDETEKKQAFVNAALDAGVANLEKMGGVAGAAADPMAQMEVAIRETGEALGAVLLPSVAKVSTKIRDAAKAVQGFLDKFTSTTLEKAIEDMERLGVSVDTLARLRGLQALEEALETLPGSAEDVRSSLERLTGAAESSDEAFAMMAVQDVMERWPQVAAKAHAAGLSIEENWTQRLYDAAHQTDLLGEQVGLSMLSLREKVEALAEVEDPLDPEILERINPLMGEAAMMAAQLGEALSRGEIGRDAYEQVSEKLLGYLARMREMIQATAEYQGAVKQLDTAQKTYQETLAEGFGADTEIPGLGPLDLDFGEIDWDAQDIGPPPEVTDKWLDDWDAYWEAQREQTEEAMAGLRERRDQHFLTDEELLQKHLEQELALWEGNEKAQGLIREVYEKKADDLDRERNKILLQAAGEFFGAMETVAKGYGKEGFAFAKSMGIARAIVSTYQGAAQALASVPFPANLLAVTAVLAQGFAQVRAIRAQEPPSAHAGLGYVPKDATYLLSAGERVLAPRQNEDLSRFLKGQETAPRTQQGALAGSLAETLEVNVNPNATTMEGMNDMTDGDWRLLVSDSIIPMLEEMAAEGLFSIPRSALVEE